MTKTACVFVLLMAWSSSGSAQRWSSEQQELVAQVKRCNDGWSESIKQKKLASGVDPPTRIAAPRGPISNPPKFRSLAIWVSSITR
jgi:hypothetical protein